MNRRRRARVLAPLAIAAAWLWAALAGADQTAPRLDELFTQLANAPGGRQAAAIEQRIWQAWFEHEDTAAAELLARARDRAQAGDAASAEALFDELVATHPAYAEAWNQRAILRYLQGDLDGSLADIAQALALEPRHFGALSGRGQCLFRLERYAEAADAFRDALSINPWLDSVRMQLDMLEALLNERAQPI